MATVSCLKDKGMETIAVGPEAAGDNTEQGLGALSALGSAPLKPDLEQAFVALAADDKGVFTSPERAAATSYLRGHHDNSQVALRLAELMMSAPKQDTRHFAEIALVGTCDQKAVDLITLEESLRKLGKSPSAVTQDELRALNANRADPLVSKRLLEIVVSSVGGYDGAYHAAQILNGTPDKATQDALREALREVVNGMDSPSAWDRAKRQHLPRALKGSTDAEIQELLVKAVVSQSWHNCALVRACAAALGPIKTDAVKEVLVDSVFNPSRDWEVRSGVIEALREQMDESIRVEITPLIDGNKLKTAWLIAERMSSTTFGRIRAAWRLFAQGEAELHCIRVQAALILADQQPEIAQRALADATLSYYCQPYIQKIAKRELERLEIAEKLH